MPLPTFFCKNTVPIIAVFFIYILVIFSLDQHYDGHHPTCPLCVAQNLFNGTQGSFVLKVVPMIAYRYSVDKLFYFDSPYVWDLETGHLPNHTVLNIASNRAPPILS
jgi:hypothetical protein